MTARVRCTRKMLPPKIGWSEPEDAAEGRHIRGPFAEWEAGGPKWRLFTYTHVCPINHIDTRSESRIGRRPPLCSEAATLDGVHVLPTSALKCSSPFRQSCHCFALMLHVCPADVSSPNHRDLPACRPRAHGTFAVDTSRFASSIENRLHIMV